MILASGKSFQTPECCGCPPPATSRWTDPHRPPRRRCAASRQQPHQFVLRTIRVLVLVDQHVLEAPVVVFAHLRRSLQQAHGFQQQVVEIQRVRLRQFFLVLGVNLRHPLGLRIGRLQVYFLRIEHVVLRPRNMRQHRTRRSLLVVDPQPPHDRLDQLLLIGLVVNRKAFGCRSTAPPELSMECEAPQCRAATPARRKNET